MKKSNKGCAERRQHKRYGPGARDPIWTYRANHPEQLASSFSFNFKPGEKEKFFRNGGKEIYSPANWSIPRKENLPSTTSPGTGIEAAACPKNGLRDSEIIPGERLE